MLLALTLAAAAIAAACVAPAALAGDYTVSMGETFGCVNHSWSHSTTMSLYNSYDMFCTGALVDDISAAVNANGGRSNYLDNAQSTFNAPAGTWISHADISWSDYVDLNHNFGVGLHYLDGAGTWHNLATCLPGSSCTLASEDIQSTWPGDNWDFPAGTQVVGAFAICGASWCDHTPENGEWAQAWVELHSAQVTIHEDTTPAIAYTGGGLASGAWLHGIQAVTFNSSDPSGIRRAQLWIDGNRSAVMADSGDRACDYTYTVPCSNVAGGSLALDTSAIGNGTHSFRISTENAAGNWSDGPPIAFYVDNTAPGEVTGASVKDGQGWHTTNSFTIDWTNPADVAPITTAYYEVCDSGGQNCRQGSQSGHGISELRAVQVPAPGTYKVRIWVGDAAGNISAAKSPFLTLAYDDMDPGPAVPVQNPGWVNAAHASSYVEEIDPPSGSGIPVSGIAGYAVTTDGSDPGTTINVTADAMLNGAGHYTFADLPEGTTTVKARSISGAGLAALQVGVATIRVDRTPPTVTLSGNPDPNQWSRVPVTVAINAQDALSGMAGAPTGDPDPTHGAYVGYSLDGGATHDVSGPSAIVASSTDGSHVVAYQAFDLAGNSSPQSSVYFKIDRTPPVAGFEAQDAADPTKLSVLASDAMSGLADGGAIAIRPDGAGGWTKLATVRDGSRYYAHVDPASMAPGTYDVEAVIPDQAGNTVTTTTRTNDGGTGAGLPELIVIDGCRINGLLDTICAAESGAFAGGGGAGATGSGPGANAPAPYTVVDNLYAFELGPDGRPYDYGATVDTAVHAGIVVKQTSKRQRHASKCRKAKKRGRHAARMRKCKRWSGARRLVDAVELDFGKAATVRGSVTLANGAPLAEVPVLVLQRYDAAGMRYTPLTTVTTDRAGSFTYTVAAGASRTIAFLYRGSSLYRHASATVDVAVTAGATIRANKHVVRNGRSVTFTGRLLGGPFPQPGKLVALQAFYRNRWRTFATTRADSSGAWRYTYRFGATRGRVVYRFRAQVNREAAYPYLLGYSKTIAVRVTG